MRAAIVDLGRCLYDERMSVNGKEFCGSCHRHQLAFTDGRAHAEGTTGQVHPRSSMSVVNVAYVPFLTWANPILTSLGEQALILMLGLDPVELGLRGHETDFLAAVRTDPVYQRLFPQAFPGDGDTYALTHVTKAITAFERKIIPMHSPYDRCRREGDPSAMSDAAKRGELLFFFQRAGCVLPVNSPAVPN